MTTPTFLSNCRSPREISILFGVEQSAGRWRWIIADEDENIALRSADGYETDKGAKFAAEHYLKSLFGIEDVVWQEE